MSRISSEKCFNHRQREAVALCPECRRFFCRECVTEHNDRAICASCLRKLAPASPSGKVTIAIMGSVLKAAAGFLVLWLLFFYFGLLLLKIPSSVHEGSMWRDAPHESFHKED